jgi:hypothetical protein
LQRPAPQPLAIKDALPGIDVSDNVAWHAALIIPHAVKPVVDVRKVAQTLS